jgi:FixJ family two-component response regulator
MSDSRVVALIDDDLAVLASLKFLLELAGYRVAAYSSASAFLGDRGIGAACLIVDQHMPQMTGLELAARVRLEGSTIPLLLVTGSPSPAIAARAAELGVEAVLEKPPNERDLLRFIDAHC